MYSKYGGTEDMSETLKKEYDAAIIGLASQH
jgi:hypothetical protein